MPGFRQDPGTSQDLAATRGCILEPARIWQPPQQGDITNTFLYHRYRQSKITFIDKLGSHQVSSYSHQGLFGWSHEKTAWSPKPGSIWPQASKPSRFLRQHHLTKEDWMSFKFLVTINSRCTTVQVSLSVDGLLKNVLAQHLPDTLYIFYGNIYRRFEILQNTIIYENTSRNYFLKSYG
jgi:hypothetical protein